MTKLAGDKQIQAHHADGSSSKVRKRAGLWRRLLLGIWIVLIGLWLASMVAPWQFSMQTTAYRTHVYLIDGTLYWQHEIIHRAHAGSFIKLGLLSHAHLLAPATRLLIITNGVGTAGGVMIGLRGLVYSSNPLAGSGLWLSRLVLGVILIGPLVWWGARRLSRRKAASPQVRKA